jgi:YVTN family beta-propeller protein
MLEAAVAAGMEVRLLGPIEVFTDGRPVQLSGVRQRALLALLALRANEVVSSERLVEALFGVDAAPSAVNAVHAAVSRLRRLLEDGVLETRAPGYVLHVPADRLDTARFERLYAEGRELLEGGDAPAAAAVLRSALELFRGAPLADLSTLEFAQAEIRRLEDMRTAALMERIDADLAMGRSTELVAELEALVRADPLQERLRGQLMLALYRCGRQADALRVYQDARERLVEDLGLEPSAALQRLERAILNHDPALEPPAGTSQYEVDEPRAAPARRRHRRAVVAFGAAAVLIGAAAAVVAVLVTAGHGAVRVTPNAIAGINPTTNTVTRSIPLDARPTSIATEPTGVWVLNRGSATLSEIDPGTLKRVKTIGLGGYPSSLIVSGRMAWVEDAATGAVSGINLDDGRVIRRELGSARRTAPTIGATLVAADHLIWATRSWPPALVPVARTMTRIFPPPRPRRESIALPDIASAAAANGDVWITSSTSGTVSVVHPQDGGLVAHIPVGRSPAALALGGGAAWVASVGNNTVSRIDPTVFRIVAKIRLTSAPTALAFDPADHALWVASRAGGTVTRIDARSNRVVETLRIGNEPAGLAVGHGRVWVTVDPR